MADLEQSLSDTDQSSSDEHQGAADSDDSASIADQRAADSDRAAAKRDQASADGEHAGVEPGTTADKRYEIEAEQRLKSEQVRDASSYTRQLNIIRRASAAIDRDESASIRDQVATARDMAAAARDRREAYEEAIVRQQFSPGDARLESALAIAADLRERSAAARKRAAEDRARAAADRQAAAEERRLARAELQRAQIDALTGAYLRELGYMTLENEITRSRRSEGDFVLAFMDVDHLKKINDEQGHDAGDALLTRVVEVLRQQLRTYDPVVRVGGDEFICGLVGMDIATGLERATEIRRAVSASAGSSVTIGLAELEPDDSLDALISRADADMYRHKEHHAPGSLED